MTNNSEYVKECMLDIEHTILTSQRPPECDKHELNANLFQQLHPQVPTSRAKSNAFGYSGSAGPLAP